MGAVVGLISVANCKVCWGLGSRIGPVLNERRLFGAANTLVDLNLGLSFFVVVMLLSATGDSSLFSLDWVLMKEMVADEVTVFRSSDSVGGAVGGVVGVVLFNLKVVMHWFGYSLCFS